MVYRFRGHAIRCRSLLLLFILCAASYGTPAQTGNSEPVIYSLGDRILTLGSWGADVFELQLLLRKAGYNIQADGLFGRETQRAVQALQVAYGLEPDGIVGPATLAALRAQHGTIEYVVQPGDSLWAIARRFDTTMEDIYMLNRLTTTVLRVGQRLLVPAPPYYVVQPGDTLSGIAARFQTTVEALIDLNGITQPDLIRVGQKLRLPRTVLR